MKFFCEEHDGELWVRGRCCIDRMTGELREDYSGWIVRELEVTTPNILCDSEGRLIWKVVGEKVERGVAPLTDKEQAARAKPTLAEEVEILKGQMTELMASR